MTPNAIYSKSGKGVQEASGKTSLLSRGDRAVLSAFDGRLSVSDVADRVGKPFDTTFQRLILQLERDGYIREVAPGTAPSPPRQRPRPPEPRRISKLSSSTGKRHSSTSGSVSLELVM